MNFLTTRLTETYLNVVHAAGNPSPTPASGPTIDFNGKPSKFVVTSLSNFMATILYIGAAGFLVLALVITYKMAAGASKLGGKLVLALVALFVCLGPAAAITNLFGVWGALTSG